MADTGTPAASAPGLLRAVDIHPAVARRGTWHLVYSGFAPAEERMRETLCTTGNGYFATRGAAPEASAGAIHYPGTYINGVFNRLTTRIAGKLVESESLVNIPNWLPLTFRVEGGPWFRADAADLLEYEQDLDLRQGVLTRSLRFRDQHGRHTRLVQRRLASMDNPHLAAMETTIIPEDWSGRVEIRSGLDGGVANTGIARYRELASQHLEAPELEEVDGKTIGLRTRTTQSRIHIALAARTEVRTGDHQADIRRVERSGWQISQVIQVLARQSLPLLIEKTVSIYTSRDPAISEPGMEARRALTRAEDFPGLLHAHVVHMDNLWNRLHLDLAGEEQASFILNLHVFHLMQTISDNTVDMDVGIPARGLHGEAYRGHVFWDGLFAVPYLSFTIPELTRSLLRYRYRRLPEARRAARDCGCKGAMFPWQSGSDGREESQTVHLNPRSGRWRPDYSTRQRHVNAAIAYDLWTYYEFTGDLDFMCGYGAEMLLEIARFWASIARYDEARGRYVIEGVMGPDEYHDGYPWLAMPGLANNAYTNVMAVWVLCHAMELLGRLPEQNRAALSRELDLGPAEIARWEDVSRRMFVPFHEDGVISQFEGYERLAELDWDGYLDRYGDIQRLDRILEAESDSTNQYKASKQADVLMLFYLLSAEELCGLLARLGYSWKAALIPRTIDYYLRRTSHGSTLSRVVHSWVLARANRPGSWELFTQALASDVADIQGGTTAEGIHLGAMAGTVNLVACGYTGIEARAGVLWLNPCLPPQAPGLSLTIRYRGHWGIKIRISGNWLEVTVPPSAAPPITIGYQNRLAELEPGATFSVRLSRG